MSTDFVILEELFSPSEAETCTDLSPSQQQDWLGHGRQPAGAAVSAHQLAEARLMLTMCEMGLTPSSSRALAVEGAPSVLWLALTGSSHLGGGGAIEQARAYREHLERLGDDHLQQMAGLMADGLLRYGIARDQEVEFVPSVSSEDLDDRPEVVIVLSLPAVARKLVHGLKRPLFTIIIPPIQDTPA